MANKRLPSQVENIHYGSGTPETNVIGDIGDIYIRIDVNAESNLYSKMGDAGGNTNWFYPEGGWTQASSPTFTITTNNPGGGTNFDPSALVSSGSILWTFEDSSTLSGTSIFTTGNGLDGTSQDVVVTIDDVDLLTFFNCTNDNILALDFSNLTEIGSIAANSNANLASIAFPAAANLTGSVQATSASLTTIDFQGSIFSSAASFNFGANSGLTSLDLSGASGVVTSVDVNSTALTSLDMSTIGVVGSLSAYSITTLTSMDFPLAGTSNFTGQITCSGLTNLLTFNGVANTIDLTGYTISDDINFSSCPLITTVVLGNGITLGTGDAIRFNNCAVNSYVDMSNITVSGTPTGITITFASNAITSVSDINQMLVDLDAILPNGGSGTISLNGGSNATPDGATGGFDGTTAKTNLQGKGYTVNTN